MLSTVVGSDRTAGNGVAEVAVLEILRAVEESMTRFGLAGRLRIEGRNLILDSHGVPASVELGMLVEQWPGLAPEVRSRRCQDIARRFQQQRHGAVSVVPSSKKTTIINPKVLLGLVAAVVVGLLLWFAPLSVGWLTAYEPAPTSKQKPAATAAVQPSAEGTLSGVAAYEAERRARALRVCQNTQARVLQGATVGPTDVEGWLLELLLFSEGTHDWVNADALGEFVDQAPDNSRHVVWPAAPDLISLEGVGTEVTVSPLVLERPTDAPADVKTQTGIQLTFHGRYVIPYFREEQRINYIRFANALGDRLGAQQGALFARCDGERSHHLGVWFRGPSPGMAAASLMFAMSAHAAVPHLQAEVLSADPDADFEAAHCWHQLATHSADLPRPRIAKLLSGPGGMIAGPPDGVTSITFPFKEANRAARASLLIAQDLKIAAVR